MSAQAQGVEPQYLQWKWSILTVGSYQLLFAYCRCVTIIANNFGYKKEGKAFDGGVGCLGFGTRFADVGLAFIFRDRNMRV